MRHLATLGSPSYWLDLVNSTTVRVVLQYVHYQKLPRWTSERPIQPPEMKAMTNGRCHHTGVMAMGFSIVSPSNSIGSFWYHGSRATLGPPGFMLSCTGTESL